MGKCLKPTVDLCTVNKTFMLFSLICSVNFENLFADQIMKNSKTHQIMTNLKIYKMN